MEIIRVKDEDDAKICDEFLTKLIKYESGLDKLINSKFVVNDFYTRAIQNENKYLALAVAKGNPIGFVYAYRHIAKGTSFKDNMIEIDGLFVEENYRKLGIGTALIKSVQNWAKQTYGSGYIDITYLISNIPAEKCYTKLGFSPAKIVLRKKI